jgi:hypothetical protein
MISKETIAAQQAQVLDRIPVDFGDGAFLHAKARKLGEKQKKELLGHLRLAETIARPKAMYLPAPVRLAGANTVDILGHEIDNPVMADHLRGLHRVFVYVATCGQELAEWKASLDSAVDRFFADLISESALSIAGKVLRAHVTARYHAPRLASMNPGSTRGWPIEGQRVIFSILADARERIGVELHDSFFMAPTHSGSGILFESEKGYQNCQLCGLENCPNRKAAFDPNGFPPDHHAV